jgi:hypothetical protein
MRLILKGTILSLTLFVVSLFLNSCVDEPTIDPVKRPSSLVRVVNISNNLNNIKVSIDGAFPVQSLNSLAIASGTEFFDIPAGKKTFRVFDEAGTLLYSRDVEITSFEMMTIVFAGQYDLDELLNSFGSFDLSEGETYVNHAPAADSALIYFVHGSAPVDTSNSRSYTSLQATYPANGGQRDTTYNLQKVDGSLDYGEVYGFGAGVGDYSFRLTSEAGVAALPVVNIEAGFRYYMFLYGNPNNVQVFVDKVVPPAIRPRD